MEVTAAGVSPSSSASLAEQEFVRWFTAWTKEQRRTFLERLLPLITPNKLFALMGSVELESSSGNFIPLSMTDCGSFEEQVHVVLAHVKTWTSYEANSFMSALEEVDYVLLCELYDKVAATAGEV